MPVFSECEHRQCHSPHRHAFAGPFVTSVGGTTSYPEVAAPLSAGGFSDYFERPDYQDEALPIFFENLGNQYAGLYK